MTEATPAEAKAGYHHGNLRAALVQAGYDLAVEKGPDAVTLRAVTRRAGVTPAAAYRHFTGLDELRVAIGLRSMRGLARSIEEHQARVAVTDPTVRARALLEAVGDGYIAFALDQPRAFRIGLHGLLSMEHAELPEGAGATGRTPFQLLTDALGGLAAVGALLADDLQPAAIRCWSGVHGFASLATQGPLREVPRAVRDAMATRLVRDIVDGVLGVGGPSARPR
ncbi:MAG: TetR/AcrR family transcriptional regulator [Micropruina sp.]|uniref:TetR/AcrR family transcriptional regulator n=1 Tax=Micropruina sp. TaxID=2737536 RepID=UPI0039E59703